MCLIVFSYNQHPVYKLILAANRDEFYRRPTEPARFWNEHPSVLAGKDLKAGGTWMGVTKEGSFSALTNYRDFTIQRENPPSRGHLVRDYLTGTKDPNVFLQGVDKLAHRYNGFNLLVGNTKELMYYSNQQQEIHRLSQGLYGLSNHLLNTPWYKVEQARNALQNIINRDDVTEENLFRVLENDRKATDDVLPDTGLSLEMERAVSSVFIRTDGYGTRASTLLLIDREGQVTFVERQYQPETAEISDTNRFEFQISS